MILVSSCLAGINCKYSGANNLVPSIRDLVNEGKAIPICPEQLGGLTTPRVPAEIVRDTKGKIRVVTKDGKDVTKEYILGAERALAVAKVLGIRWLFFKEEVLHVAAVLFMMVLLQNV